jgi:hypothetical protein
MTGLHAACRFQAEGIDRSVRESSGRLKKRRGLIAAALGMGTNLAGLLEMRYAIQAGGGKVAGPSPERNLVHDFAAWTCHK